MARYPRSACLTKRLSARTVFRTQRLAKIHNDPRFDYGLLDPAAGVNYKFTRPIISLE
jgi:hypothetical protein